MVNEQLYPALQVTNRCNKQCTACLRSANSTTDSLNFADFQNYLVDLSTLARRYRIQHQFVTGGEPTIWKDNGHDIKDILIAMAASGLIHMISMPTNGKVFEDLSFARDFFSLVSKGLPRQIIVGVSIATYQGNLGDEGYIALDNLVSLSQAPDIKILPVILVTLSIDDDTDVRLKTLYPHVFQRVTPLAPLGNAADMDELCPSLTLSGNNKATLGAYLPYFRKEAQSKCGIPETEFNDTPNAVIMDRLSHHNHCGNSPFIDENWHYCLPLEDDARYDLCPIGGMQTETISDFIAQAPAIASMRAQGIVTAMSQLKDSLSPQARDRLQEMYTPTTLVAVAYRGCMLCKELYDRGILQELNGRPAR